MKPYLTALLLLASLNGGAQENREYPKLTKAQFDSMFRRMPSDTNIGRKIYSGYGIFMGLENDSSDIRVYADPQIWVLKTRSDKVIDSLNKIIKTLRQNYEKTNHNNKQERRNKF